MLVDTLSFYIVILLLTLVEGFRRLDPPSRLWREWNGKLRMRRPVDFPGEDRWGWRYLTPGRHYATHLLPIALDGHGVAAASKDFAGQRTLEGVADFHAPYASASVEDRWLTIGKVRVRCQSALQAARLRLLLARLQPLPPERREEEIRRYLAESCSANLAAGARRTAAQATRGIARCGMALQVVLLLGFPLAAYFWGLAAAVIVCGALAIALSIAIAQLHRQAYAELFAGLPPSGWGDFLRLSVYPIGAAQAATELTTEALGGFHPVAMDARQAGAEELRRVRHWLPGDDPQAETTRRWHYAALCQAVEHSLRDQGFHPEALLQVTRQSPASLSYCPRCAGQYSFASGPCPDCPGRQVVPFP